MLVSPLVIDSSALRFFDYDVSNTSTAAGRTVRGVADALTFVEGGRDAFWYKKQ